MKKILLVLSLTLPALILSAQSDTLLDRAVRAYDNGKFEEALDIFRLAESRGGQSAELYYNMGNAAFRSNLIGYAILYYEKALKEDPGMANAAYNLNYVSRYREDQLENVPELFIRTWVRTLVRSLNSTEWAVISGLLFLLTLFALIVYIFTRNLTLRKTGFFTAAGTLLLFVFALLAGIRQYQREQHPEEAIIVSPSAIVRSTPNSSGNDLFILHEGTKVHLLKSLNDWQNIRISDGRVGWVEKGTMEDI